VSLSRNCCSRQGGEFAGRSKGPHQSECQDPHVFTDADATGVQTVSLSPIITRTLAAPESNTFAHTLKIVHPTSVKIRVWMLHEKARVGIGSPKAHLVLFMREEL
jgi:hypothetical protein